MVSMNSLLGHFFFCIYRIYYERTHWDVEPEARQDKRGKIKDLRKIEGARHGDSAFGVGSLKMKILKTMARK